MIVMKSDNSLKMSDVLTVLENPYRRQIVKRLSQEPNYAFQLAKETGQSQQQIANHLKIMENAGIVTSSTESGVGGPQRQIYELSKSFTITLDVAPHLYNEKLFDFDVTPDRSVISSESIEFLNRVDKIAEYPGNKDRIKPLAGMLSDIDDLMANLEEERLVLLYIRNLVMSEASKVIQRLDDSEARMAVHSAVDEHDSSEAGIAKSLNLREERVRELLEKIKKEIKTDFF
jgi:predicted transcriptional regulator